MSGKRSNKVPSGERDYEQVKWPGDPTVGQINLARLFIYDCINQGAKDENLMKLKDRQISEEIAEQVSKNYLSNDGTGNRDRRVDNLQGALIGTDESLAAALRKVVTVYLELSTEGRETYFEDFIKNNVAS